MLVSPTRAAMHLSGHKIAVDARLLTLYGNHEERVCNLIVVLGFLENLWHLHMILGILPSRNSSNIS